MSVLARVVLPVHDAGRTLGDQLRALADQSGAPDFEVVVVLNRCSDDSASVARLFAPTLPLRIVEANELASAAHARNVGANGASAPFLLFCDADDRVAPGWVTAMVSALRGGADLVGGRIVVDRDGLPSWIYRWRYEGLDGRCTHVGPTALPYALGASLGCTRAAFEHVRGFNEAFLAGFEEVELAARLLRSGFRIGEAPEAIVSYKPRTTMRGALAQSRGYARGWIDFEATEGTIEPPLSRWSVAERLMRRVAHLVLREHERPPQLVFCRIAEQFYRLEEARRWWVRQAQQDITPPPA